MHKQLIVPLVLLLLADKTYQGPLTGQKHDTDFSFRFSSDWASNRITNNVSNDHESKGLVVTWRGAGIIRTALRPIPKGKSDTVKYFCREAKLSLDDKEMLRYGLSATAMPAAVYEMAQDAEDKIESEVSLSTDLADAPFVLKVTSSAKDEAASYHIVKEGRFNFAIQLPEPTVDSLRNNDAWKIEDAMKSLDGMNDLLKALPGNKPLSFRHYYLLKSDEASLNIQIRGASFSIEPRLVIIADTENVVVGTGLVSLHVPKSNDR
jgi:hypothetical protein